MTEPEAPQSEGGEPQTEAPTEKTYTQAEVDKIVSAWAEKVERKERRAERYKTDLEQMEAKFGDLEKRASQFSDTEAGKRIKELEAERENLAGKYRGLWTDAVASSVAGELSADAGVVSTMINGLRAQGVLDREPEDPVEAAKAWADALREKHGAFFTTTTDKEPEKPKTRQAGIIPPDNEAKSSYQRAIDDRRKLDRKAGGRGIVI